MKLLLIHADSIEWTPTKKAIASADEKEKIGGRAEEALVVLTAVEKGDVKDKHGVVEGAVDAIADVLKKVGAKEVVVYPYAHLSPNLAKPADAQDILNSICERLKANQRVKLAPFGWYKTFSLKAKGHPLAELSKEITPGAVARKKDTEVPEALKKEAELKSSWFMLDSKGKQYRLEKKADKVVGFDFSRYPNLGKLARHEMAKSRVMKEEPPHIKLMKKLGIAGHEPGSDPGNVRWPPKGRLMKSLIEEWVTKNVLDHGAMEVETPIMYDVEHPALKSYLNRFPARQYSIETPNKNVFLRFSACFGQFLMVRDANISYRNLPLSVYELTRYSFRAEQHGELAGLRRLRAFTMPDCHALVRDLNQAKKELLARFELSKKVQRGLGFDLQGDFELAIRMTEDFWKEHRDLALALVRKWKKPCLIELWDKKFFYFVFKYELNFVDALEKAAALTTDQIDVDNAERYGLEYTDKDNRRKKPLILHLSPSGAIERVFYALLEKAHMQQEAKKNPVFPLWLSPTQVRLCPVSDASLPYTKKILNQLEDACVRADLDDRVESVGKKVRDAEVEWVPRIVVIGEKERKSGKLAVRYRESGKVKVLKADALIKEIKRQTDGFPFKPLPLPKLLSRRPEFN